MADRSSVSGLGMVAVAVAVVSTGVILASYHLIHRRLDSNLKLDTSHATVGNLRAEQRRQSRTKKKVRFADDVAAPADTSSEYHGRLRATTAESGKLVRPALRKVAYSHLAC